MARLLIDSFETQNMGVWDSVDAPSIVSTNGLDMKGDYCCSTANSTSSYFLKNVTATSRICMSFLWRLSSMSAHMVTIIFDNGQVDIYVSSNGRLNYTLFGSTSLGIIYFSTNITYFVQIECYKTGGSVRLVAKIDGIVDKDRSRSNSSTVIESVKFMRHGYFDNIVIDDAVVPEETEVGVLRPKGVGAYSDFVPTPSGLNYTNVDEVPYSDSDYVSSGIVNAIDTYQIEDILNAKSIKCVQAQVRARKDSDSPLTKFNFVRRSVSTNYHGNDISLTNTFSSYCELWDDGPTGSGIWHPSSVNSLEIGVRTRV